MITFVGGTNMYLPTYFIFLVFREIVQLTGTCAATAKSLDYLLGLGPKKKGRCVLIHIND